MDLLLSPSYFSRLSSKYGNKFYVRENGEDLAIVNAIEDMAECLVGEEGMCNMMGGQKK